MSAKRPTIRKRKDFLSAAARGRKFVTSSFVLQMLERPEGHPAPAAPRLGYTVTRKMGGAVVRNRIKRRLRAATAALPAHLLKDGNDYVVIARHKAQDRPFADLARDMEFAFSRISSMKKPSIPETVKPCAPPPA